MTRNNVSNGTMDDDKTGGEHQLLYDLFNTGYDHRERPVKTPNQAVDVDLSFSVILIISMVRTSIFQIHCICKESVLFVQSSSFISLFVSL